MHSKSFMLSQLLLGQAYATYLYTSSYSGVVSTLQWTESGLETISSTTECGGSASWLTLADDLLYCTDEAWSTPEGSVSTFKTLADGSLELLGKKSTRQGAVSAVVYGKDDSGLALAYYSSSAFTTWDRSDPSALELLQTEVYELAEPGANPERQEAPHPHQALLDPTGQYILVPDLGADLVRVYKTGTDDLAVTAVEPLQVPAGSGPRHAAFVKAANETYLYVVTELTNKILGYIVNYNEGSLGFEQVYESGTHGQGVEVPSTAAAAEILVSPDQKFLIVSSRYENAFEIPNFDTSNSTQIVSDTLINFSVNHKTGALKPIQAVPAGGKNPRQFSFNRDASAVAVGLQGDGRVVIIERSKSSGRLGRFVASAEGGGEVSAVIFNEAI
uniref:6-phosphogluconolactonase n=1 Tax=Bionectria ochroleuca TaxID=29856 RepID=A0A8H7TVL7_BIOOC